MYSIGVDIGGMSIKIGLVDDEGVIIKKIQIKTEKDYNQAIKDMVEVVNNILEEEKVSLDEIRGIGIGCPGAVDSKNGIIEYLPNLGWDKVPIKEIIRKQIKTEIMISNDANVAALGEAIYGCAKQYQNSIMLTIGTGVGGGIIIDKKLIEGGWSRGAELGHITLFMDGEQCTCGRKGCIECYASATALITQTKNAMEEDGDSKMWEYCDNDLNNVNGKTAFECSKLGDETAIKVVDKFISYLGESALNMFNIFRPEALIIGGGISGQGKYLTDKIKDYCEKFDYGYKRAPRTEIMTATLGNDAGIIGAAALLR